MNLFSKKESLFSPVDGIVKSITETNDELFATKSMGDGFVVIPTANEIYSPISGTVVAVFPTKHAISLKKGKMEFLLHLGIDTVELNGEGFDIKVSSGDIVNEKMLLGTVDFDFVKRSNKATDVVFVCTNLKEKQQVNLSTLKEVNHSEKVGFIE